MVLPGCVLFPHTLLPLRIFEPRYRKMLAEALASHRMFAVGMPDASLGGRRPRAVAGLGIIRACVEQEDGTSNLILQGVARVRFDTFSRTSPLFEGKPEPMPTAGSLSEGGWVVLRRLVEEVLGMAGCRVQLPEGLAGFLREMEDADMLADLMAGTFLQDPHQRQEILETPAIELRVERLANGLRAEYPSLSGR